MTPSFTFIELFAGIGGFRLGCEAAGGQCLFACEIDRNARATYQSNFWDRPVFVGHDVRAFSQYPRFVKPHDLLTAGFPCQPFSSNNMFRSGLEDVRGNLMFNILKIIRHHRPKAFLLENVPNFLSINQGKVIETLSRHVRDLGYHMIYDQMSSHPWVPQKRRCVFFAGFREKNGFTFADVEIPSDPPVLRDILETDPHPKYTMSDERWAFVRENKYVMLDLDTLTPTIVSSNNHQNPRTPLVPQEKENPRLLTPLEYSRLMGFNTAQGTAWRIPLSDHQAYRQFGNAVVVPQVTAIVNAMKPFLS